MSLDDDVSSLPVGGRRPLGIILADDITRFVYQVNEKAPVGHGRLFHAPDGHHFHRIIFQDEVSTQKADFPAEGCIRRLIEHSGSDYVVTDFVVGECSLRFRLNANFG